MKTTYTIQSILDAGHDAEQAPAVLALCQHLDCGPDAISLERHDHYGLPVYSAGGEYAIGTDDEAQSAAEANIREHVWAFNASFILDECCLPDELEEGIRAAQEKQCESANDWLSSLVEKCCEGGMKAFAESAISADGRGHFMSSYDGEENEETICASEDAEENDPFYTASNGAEEITFYIYRTN